MLIYVVALVALIGLIVYAISQSPKAAEIGRIMFFCGLLVFLFLLGPRAISVLGR